jgi:hypothetical protein
MGMLGGRVAASIATGGTQKIDAGPCRPMLLAVSAIMTIWPRSCHCICDTHIEPMRCDRPCPPVGPCREAQGAAGRPGIYCGPLSGYTAEAGGISRRAASLTESTNGQIVRVFYDKSACALER